MLSHLQSVIILTLLTMTHPLSPLLRHFTSQSPIETPKVTYATSNIPLSIYLFIRLFPFTMSMWDISRTENG